MVRTIGTMLIRPMSPGPLIDILSVKLYFPEKIAVPWKSDFAATGVFAAHCCEQNSGHNSIYVCNLTITHIELAEQSVNVTAH